MCQLADFNGILILCHFRSLDACTQLPNIKCPFLVSVLFTREKQLKKKKEFIFYVQKDIFYFT